MPSTDSQITDSKHDTSDQVSQSATFRGGPLSLDETALSTLPPPGDSPSEEPSRTGTDRTEMTPAQRLRALKNRISKVRATTCLGMDVLVQFSVVTLTSNQIWHQTTIKWVSGTREWKVPDRKIVLGVRVDLAYPPHYLGKITSSLLPGVAADYSIKSPMFDPKGERMRTSLKEEIDHANQIVSEHWYKLICDESSGMRQDKVLAAMKDQISKWLVTDLTNVFVE